MANVKKWVVLGALGVGALVHLFPDQVTTMVNGALTTLPLLGKVTLQRVVGGVSAWVVWDLWRSRKV